MARAPAAVADGSRLARFRASLSPQDWVSLAGMAGFILLLNVLGWGVLALFIAPRHYDLGPSGVFGVGLGVTAFLLGSRHAFDADHIAAIDNTTRKLVGENRRAMSVGFFFSLGHSTVVFTVSLMLALGFRALAGQIGPERNRSALQENLGLVSTIVSGVFLMLIGLINLVALVGIVKVFRQMRSGALDEAEMERQLNSRGFMARILGPIMRSITKPWQMYPVGLLFGLGFDTASQVALLVLAAGSAAFALPWYAVLVLPTLFAAGMCIFDTLDGVFMSRAYGWAFLRPVRKVFYNLAITALSVAIALIIGLIELLGLLAEKLGIDSGFLGWIASLKLGAIGYTVVVLFIATWLIALTVWRFGRIEERWSTPQTTATD